MNPNQNQKQITKITHERNKLRKREAGGKKILEVLKKMKAILSMLYELNSPRVLDE